nr:acyl-CoA desaturase [Micromonospora sp. DSM 115978]
YLFFPMLLLEGLNLHVEGVRDVARRWRRGSSEGQGRRGPDRAVAVEAGLLLGHAVAYLAIVAAVLPLGKAVAFVAVHQALFGLYMGCAFAPNHKGMPVSTRSDADFLRRQVLTSRNVRGGALTDVVLGGLNYQ